MNPFDLSMTQLQEMLADENLEADLQAQLAAMTVAPTPIAGIATPLDPFGAAHMIPGDMGTIGLTAPWPHVDLVVDGHFTSFQSSSDSVVDGSSLSNFVGQASASGGVRSAGQTIISVGWVDEYGNPQESTVTVLSS